MISATKLDGDCEATGGEVMHRLSQLRSLNAKSGHMRSAAGRKRGLVHQELAI